MCESPIVLIAGTHGFVGARAMIRFPEAIPVPSNLLRTPGEPLADFVVAHHPDIILNAAAISDIQTCERHPEDSYQANVVLPVALARAAEKTGAKLISFSTDQVYTGCVEEGPYHEHLALPEPANLYARHKVEAEQRVLDIHPDCVMLRATWMYDMPLYGHANRGNFLVNTLNSVMKDGPILVPGKQYRGITYVRQVVERMEQVFALPGGVYNYGSENPLNMRQTAEALLNALGAECCIRDTGESRHDLWMDCSKIKKHGILFDTTADGFVRCVRDYGLQRQL